MPLVTGMRTGLYGVPNEESLDDATQSFHELELVVVELDCEDGTEGVGFTYTIGEGGRSILEFLRSTLEPLVVGESAAPRAAVERMRAGTTFVGRAGVSELAVSAVDIALWDALGRRTGEPLYALLGGERREVPAYETDGGWLQFSEDRLVGNAEAVAREGFVGMKLKVGRGHAEDARRIRAVREALPEGTGLMVDANCSFTVPEARRFCRHVDVPLDWLEEPLPKDDYAGHADLRSTVEVPIATGENAYTEREFAQLVRMDAADVLQPDVCRVGGVTAWANVAELGRAAGLPVVPHYVEPIHVHLAAAFGNVPSVEHHSTVLDGVLASPPVLEDGRFTPPEEPGHGVRFEGLEAYGKPD
jgi:L-alanine-DL-glutamate epimerase-like enolase superfamily enzyme